MLFLWREGRVFYGVLVWGIKKGTGRGVCCTNIKLTSASKCICRCSMATKICSYLPVLEIPGNLHYYYHFLRLLSFPCCVRSCGDLVWEGGTEYERG